jgi:Cu+-exporting ATPase
VKYDRARARRRIGTAALQAPGGACCAGDETCGALPAVPSGRIESFTRQVLSLFGVVLGGVLFVVVLGEWLGLFEMYTQRVPWPLGLAIVTLGGYPVFRSVVRAARRRRVTSHTLMTVGVLAALALGEWATALVVVLFMRVSDYAERFTTDRARRAIRDLVAMAPQTARVVRGGTEVQVPLADVRAEDTVVVRPGETIPVDGEVIAGHATVDQSTITGESMPADVGPGARVFAATLARLGSLRVRATHVGPDTTFGRIISMVEEAETHRADVQRWADRFSAYYLPVVVAIAGLTLLVRHDVLATAAVLVVACSCSFALATPVAMLASVGASARRGLLIKGGRYLEALAGADVVLIDKTGTLTLGRPRITDVRPVNGAGEMEVVALAASAERYSEHPLADAVRRAAKERRIPMEEPADFEAVPGAGVRARVNGHRISVGSPRTAHLPPALAMAVTEFEARGNTVLLVSRDGEPVGLLAASDTPRPEVPAAVAALRSLGIRHIEMLTGDNEPVACALAGVLGVQHRAELLPQDKIAIVKQQQAAGRVVVMVGDGVNDAPALAQADVGIAMGAVGSDVALEAAHVALMREDWRLVAEALVIARRTMRIVKLNIAFTALYNLVGLTLAALGFLPLVLAAAAQSLPDLGILANSSRLLRQRARTPP